MFIIKMFLITGTLALTMESRSYTTPLARSINQQYRAAQFKPHEVCAFTLQSLFGFTSISKVSYKTRVTYWVGYSDGFNQLLEIQMYTRTPIQITHTSTHLVSK